LPECLGDACDMLVVLDDMDKMDTLMETIHLRSFPFLHLSRGRDEKERERRLRTPIIATTM
jgi:hypothetical protein